MTFEAFGLNQHLLSAIADKGYTTPSTIQQKAIPQILAGKDVLASAQTGTGKTASFALPIIQLLSEQPITNKRPIKALILTPTRELAAQVYEEVKEYAAKSRIKASVIFGGVGQNAQVAAIKQGIDILIATPGRLLDLQSQNLLTLAQVEFLVLDEADRMLDMGFLRDIKKILALLPNRKQNLLFSATFSDDIKKLAGTFLKNPVNVAATPENTTVEKISQKVIKVARDKKIELAIKLIWEGNWHQVLVFTRTKHGANALSQKLEKANISAAAIHGNKSQNNRTKALADFKSGAVSVLVATDIAARGLDIPLLPHVINFEIPNIPEDYVHRIGRTGRAGASGEALSLVSPDEYSYLADIEKLIGFRLDFETIEGFEPPAGASEAPIRPEKRSFQRPKPKTDDFGKKSFAKKPYEGSKGGSSAQKKPFFKKK